MATETPARPTNLLSTFVSCHANINDFQENRDINLAIARIYNSKKIKTMTELRKKITDRIELTRYELELDKVIDKYMTSLQKIKISVSYLAELGTYGLYFDEVITQGPSSTELECLSFVRDFVNNIFTKPNRLTEQNIIEFILKRNLNLRLLRLSILLSNPWDLHKNGKIYKNYIDGILSLIRTGDRRPEKAPFYQTFYGTLSDFPINQDWDFNDDGINNLFISMSNLRVFEKEDLCTFPDILENLDLKPKFPEKTDGTTARESSIGLSALKKIFGKLDIGKLDIEEETITTATVKALFDRILITDITDLPSIRSKWSSSREFFSIIPLLEEKFKCNLVVDVVVNACGIVILDDDEDDVNEPSLGRSTRDLNPEKFKLNNSKIATLKRLFDILYKNETQLKDDLKRGGGKYTRYKQSKKRTQSTTQKRVQKLGSTFDGNKYLKEAIAKLVTDAECKSIGGDTPNYVISKDNCEGQTPVLPFTDKPIYLINPNIKEASDISLKRDFLSELNKAPGMITTNWALSERIDSKLKSEIAKFNKTLLDSHRSAWDHMRTRFLAFLKILDWEELKDDMNKDQKDAAFKKLKDRFTFETMALALDCDNVDEIKNWTIPDDTRIRQVLIDGLNIVLTTREFDKHRKQRLSRGSSRARGSSRERTRERTSRSRERTRERTSRSRESGNS